MTYIYNALRSLMMSNRFKAQELRVIFLDFRLLLIEILSFFHPLAFCPKDSCKGYFCATSGKKLADK